MGWSQAGATATSQLSLAFTPVPLAFTQLAAPQALQVKHVMLLILLSRAGQSSWKQDTVT